MARGLALGGDLRLKTFVAAAVCEPITKLPLLATVALLVPEFHIRPIQRGGWFCVRPVAFTPEPE